MFTGQRVPSLTDRIKWQMIRCETVSLAFLVQNRGS
jgi:hypothetical protein